MHLLPVLITFFSAIASNPCSSRYMLLTLICSRHVGIWYFNCDRQDTRTIRRQNRTSDTTMDLLHMCLIRHRTRQKPRFGIQLTTRPNPPHIFLLVYRARFVVCQSPVRPLPVDVLPLGHRDGEPNGFFESVFDIGREFVTEDCLGALFPAFGGLLVC